MAGKATVLAAALAAMIVLTGSAVTWASSAGDVTGDGLGDVVVRGGDGRLWLFANDGAPAPANPWQWAQRRVVGSDTNFLDRMTFGDTSLDGRPDILARDRNVDNGTLWIYVHDPAQPTSPWTTRIWAGTGSNIWIFMMTGDVTGDGRVDMVTREGDGRLWLYPHNGSTSTVPFTTRQVIGANWQDTTAMLMADVTGDGRPDVVARDTDGFLWIFPAPDAAAALAIGDWDFSDRRRSAQRVGANASGPYHAGAGWEVYDQLALADVNGDGRPDVLARDLAGTLWVFVHNGAAPGTNPWPTRFPAGNWWAPYTALLAA